METFASSISKGFLLSLFILGVGFSASKATAMDICNTNSNYMCQDITGTAGYTLQNSVRTTSYCQTDGFYVLHGTLPYDCTPFIKAPQDAPKDSRDLYTYYGVRNGVNMSGTGTANACQAKLHACLHSGYADLSTVTNSTQCHTVCDNTTTNQACSTTDCYSRCDGWWGVATTCN